jgi:hypothetical protein
MASILWRSKDKGRHEWLVSDTNDEAYGLNVAVNTHPSVIGGHDQRFVETQIYDHAQPRNSRWTITVLDRETGESFSFHEKGGEGQKALTLRALTVARVKPRLAA